MIRSIVTRNVFCFPGEQRLELAPIAYGVTARHEDDPERSNWLGKSSFLQVVPLAFFNVHPKRYEDDWITDGEKEGSVYVASDLGGELLEVTRSRVRGKSTKLEACFAGKKALGDEAQKLIEEKIGMTKKDFFWTAYLEQKKISQFVDATPEARLEIAAEWFRFAKIQDGHEILRKMAVGLADAIDELRRRAAQINAEVALVAKTPTPPGVDAVAIVTKTWLNEAIKHEEEKARAVAALDATRDEVAEKRAGLKDLQRYKALVEEGKTLGASVAKHPSKEALEAGATTSRKVKEEAGVAVRSAAEDLRQKGLLLHGKFDGTCPVAGRACPVKGEINADVERNAKLHADSMTAYGKASAKLSTADSELKVAEGGIRRREQDVARLESLRVEARRLKDSAMVAAGYADGFDEFEHSTRTQQARHLLEEAQRARVQAEHDAKVAEKAVGDIASVLTQVRAHEAELATVREALAIFGRNGAQRRIAEGQLAVIEEGANATLGGSGIDLSILVRWGREGKGLAATCEACGTPFGKSDRVKSCDRCGAERGPAIQHRLDLDISDVSGAAKDLTGASFQLSAARWLRDDRSSAWSTLLIDEPFGSLDASNRRAFAGALGKLLGASGFTQAFVVAHHDSIMDSLPGRIEIVRGAKGSTVRVL